MSLASPPLEDGEKILPYETWSRLFSFLDGYTLVSVIHTCKTFQSLADQQDIWEHVVRSYRKKGEMAQKFLPDASEIAYSVADDPDLGDDDEDSSEEMLQIRKILDSAESTQEAMDQLQRDPKFQAFYHRLTSAVPDTNSLLQEAPDLLGKYFTSLQAQTDRFKSDKLSKNVDWKHIYRILSRSLTVHRELEYAGLITDDMLTTHTPVAGGVRQRLFFSLREALSVALPGDSIYLHSSQEEAMFPDNMKRKKYRIPKPNLKEFNAISVAVAEIEDDRLKARKERLGPSGAARPLSFEPRTLENYMLADGSSVKAAVQKWMNPEDIDERLSAPYMVVTTPNLTVFGRDGGHLTEEPGAGLMIPVVWAAPGGTIATVDAVRGSLFISERASLRSIDVNFEVPCVLANRGSLSMIDCNVHTMENDYPFLVLPDHGLEWQLLLDRVDIASRVDLKDAFYLYLKLTTPPLAFAEPNPRVEWMRAFRQQAMSFVKNTDLAALSANANANANPLTPEELLRQREDYLTTILTLLDQTIFDDPELIPGAQETTIRLGHLIREQLVEWLPHFVEQGNEKLIGMALTSLKSLPEDQLLSQIEAIPLHEITVPMIERFIDSDIIPFTCISLISKLCWASDVLAMKIGQNPALWKCVDILAKKCRGDIGKDSSLSASAMMSTDALRASSSDSHLLDSSSEIRRPAQKVHAACYKDSNRISLLLGLVWSFCTYPETAVLAREHALDFILWAGKEFPKASMILENICGIGHALLDCLPHNNTSRADCARYFLDNGVMDIVARAYLNFPLSEVLENADYFAMLLTELCPGDGLETFVKAGGAEALTKAIERRSKEKRKTDGTLDIFTILPRVLDIDEEWIKIKALMDDQMFTTDRDAQKLDMIAYFAHGIAKNAKRRLEFVHMGYLCFIESIAPSGHRPVALFIDSLDSLARDKEILALKAEQLKSAALHLQSFVQTEDLVSWINTVVDATKPILEGPQQPTDTTTKKARIVALVGPGRENDTKITSDGLTCTVTHHSFHSFYLDLPQGYLAQGKWAYEILLNSDGPMQLGWATKKFTPSIIENLGCGDDEHSWAVDYNRLIQWHKGIHPLSNFISLDSEMGSWMRGQVVTCMADFSARRITFTLNAEAPVVFDNVNFEDGVVPAFTLSRGQSITVNIGALPFMNMTTINSGFMPLAGMPSWTMDEIQRRMEDLNQRFLDANPFGDLGDGMFGDEEDEEGEEDEEDEEEEEEEEGEFDFGDEEDEENGEEDEDGDGENQQGGPGFQPRFGAPRGGVDYRNLARRR